MSTITTFNTNDSGATIKTGLNSNFSALNTDKIETSVLDIDGTLAANSDSKVATQKAVKTYADAINVPTCVTLCPYPNYLYGNGADDHITYTAMSTNTTAFVGQVVVPAKIIVNKLTFYCSISVAGTAKIAFFSEDGQTKKFEITTASLNANQAWTTSLGAPATLNAGVYYVVVLPVSTTNVNIGCFSSPQAGVQALNSVAGEPVFNGTITVTASTMPSTITPASITASGTSYTLVTRLDN
jgi:hypothetical protein